MRGNSKKYEIIFAYLGDIQHEQEQAKNKNA